MSLKRKINKGLSVYRNEGIIGFLILLLQFIQKHLRRDGKHGKIDIGFTVKQSDLFATNLQKEVRPWKGTTKKQLTICWVMPPPGKGSGGHTTLFRFIKYLEDAGHICHIYFYADVHKPAPVEVIVENMGTSFAPVKASMEWLPDNHHIKPCDAIFATSWETAYPVFNMEINARKMYFVQDFEPYFYPIGSYYALAENTYKMGFYGVTAGNWLATKLRRDYGMDTDFFTFGADKSTYKLTNNRKRNEVMFYARPFTSRRGFEIGVAALAIFHKEHPEYIINFVGWDVSEYNIPFPYNNLKTLETYELNEVYNRCTAGLVMSMTNMSLLPLELLSAGSIPVVNEGENNRLVSDNKYISYADCTPSALAHKLSEAVERKAQVAYAKEASQSVPDDSWDIAGEKLVTIVEKAIREPGK